MMRRMTWTFVDENIRRKIKEVVCNYKEGRDLKTERWVERDERLRKEKNSYSSFTKAYFKAKYQFSKNSELVILVGPIQKKN